MSLQARILAAFAIILVTFAIAAVVILSTQRSMLVDQVDDRLMTVNPRQIAALQAAGGLTLTQPPDGGTSVDAPPQMPIWDVYIGGTEDNGEVQPLIVGALVNGEPNVEEAIRRVSHAPGIVTVDDLKGDATYRALVLPRPDGDGAFVIAQSLESVDQAIDRLERTLLIAGAILVGTLGMIWFWIQRLGLRPIAQVTDVAESIAHGDRTSRVAIANPVTEAGKLGLAFNLMLDERDAGEQRLRQFVADASHELRTPLTSIRGYLDLVRQGAFRESDQLDDVVRRMSAETSRMNDLVQDLLVLASLDEGRPLRVSSVALGQLLEDAAQDARAIQPDRSITVEADGDGPVIEGDEALLIQLVSILVSNALHHTTADAGVTLAVWSGGGGVLMEITDSGNGMAPEVAAHVFDRFWRGEGSRSRSAGGSGLGLAIAAQIVERHHGTIALETAPGAGSRFRIALPMKQPPV